MGESQEVELQTRLNKVLELMRKRGYEIRSKVRIKVDRKLNIMGYTKREGDSYTIFVSEWSLESGMLDGLILHELAHVYFIERSSVTHRADMVSELLDNISKLEGLRKREVEYLLEAYNHLQNIIVDDLVFELIDSTMERNVKSFFQQWVTDKATGDPVADAAILCRNAFAIASLKRRNLLRDNDFASTVNRRFLDKLGRNARKDFDWIERFLESVNPNVSEEKFRSMLEQYFERIIGAMRTAPWIEDLK
jgi:hypothetical protein